MLPIFPMASVAAAQKIAPDTPSSSAATSTMTRRKTRSTRLSKVKAAQVARSSPVSDTGAAVGSSRSVSVVGSSTIQGIGPEDGGLACGEAPNRDIDLFERPSPLGKKVFRYATGVRRAPPSGSRKIAKKSLSKRMQVRSKLQFVQFYQEKRSSASAMSSDPPRTLSDTRPPKSSAAYFRIRVWKDKYGTKFYDCACGGRKPVQDLSKIKRHAIGHDKRNYTCDICGKNFQSNHLQLNAHKKIHKDEARRRIRKRSSNADPAMRGAEDKQPSLLPIPAIAASPHGTVFAKPEADPLSSFRPELLKSTLYPQSPAEDVPMSCPIKSEVMTP